MSGEAASLAPRDAGKSAGKPSAWPRWLSSEHPFPWLFPASALMVVFGIYPLVYAITLSLYKKNAATRKMVFDPDHNWTKVFYDERVWNAMCNTFLYTGIALVFQLVLGMLIALLLDSDRKGYGLLRAMMTLPLVIPPAVTAMMFLFMLNGSFGVLSRGLIAIGLLPPGFSILGTANTAMAGVLLAEIWQWTPFMVLIMLAGLRSLPKEPFEAAAIDGANAVSGLLQADASDDVEGHRHRRPDPRHRPVPRLRLREGDDGLRARHRHRNAHVLCGTHLFRQCRLPLCLHHRAAHADHRHHRLLAVHADLQGEALMELSRPWQILRDIAAVFVTSIFMFPILWWALTSIKPISAMFDKDRVVFFDFVPTLINYGVTLFGMSRSQLAIDQGLGMGVAGAEAYDSRQSILDSVIISLGSTAITMSVAVFAAYAMSRMAFKGRTAYLNWVLGQRFMPPIAILIPLVTIYKAAGMRDTDNLYMGYLGLMLIYALMNLPIAVLLMKSFFDDVPKDVDEAAMIDGATRWQTFAQGGAAHGQGRRRRLGGALLHLLLDRVPAVALPDDRHPHGSGQDSDLRDFDGQ